ncbi:MAG: 2-amino-4-hydroxy-6-hydroxymethyldihydropteridine diphosphokinase [Paracoccaceae bacterium]|nr:2-amino-4-hydroxy-6-hydroxymethyldihydropteridine diphosphokinase [Paracoccaceae bacterium]
MNDKIFVHNLCLVGNHGVMDEERVLGQRFFLDIEVTTDARRASVNDDYKKAICYGSLCELAARVSDAGPYKLIETFAERVITAILERFPTVTEARVRIRKPGAPIDASFDTVGVELARKRQRRVAFSLGSNVGDRASQIRAALAFLEAEDEIEITKVSSFYETAPWGKEDQDPFINACAIGQTSLSPHEVLRACKVIEVRLGRTPGERWGPRLIDIDLLFLGDEQISTIALTVPHAGILKRGFVLKPLAEIAGDEELAGRTVRDALSELKLSDDEVVKL